MTTTTTTPTMYNSHDFAATLGTQEPVVLNDGYYSATVESLNFGYAKNPSPITGERNPTVSVSFAVESGNNQRGTRLYKNFSWHTDGSKFWLTEFINACGVFARPIPWSPQWAQDNLVGKAVTLSVAREEYQKRMIPKVTGVFSQDVAYDMMDEAEDAMLADYGIL